MSQIETLDKDELALLKKKFINISGKINIPMVQYIRACMLELRKMDNPDIDVWITSEGGETQTAFHIYDMLRTYPGKVTGRVVGYSGSMAPVILQACNHRECLPHASIMVHSMGNRNDYDDLTIKRRRKAKAAALKPSQDRTVNILSKGCKKNKKTIRAALRAGRSFTADEALEFGLIDEVI